MNISASKARQEWADLLNRVQYGNEWVTIEKHGEPVAMVIPMEEARMLQELEDRALSEMAREALEEYERTGESHPWEEVRKELLEDD